MLRSLNAHSKISVVHQIRRDDTEEDKQLFRYLRQESSQFITASHKKVAHKQLSSGSILILKNAVWTHAYPFKGFILVRNPFSILNSAGVFRENFEDYIAHKERIFSWAGGIDDQMRPGIRNDTTADAFALLWTRKMLALYDTGIPIVRYEDFVSEPDNTLKRIIRYLGLEWEPRVLNSHLDYKHDEIGHGRIKLWEPIHIKSKDSHTALERKDFDRVYALTAPALQKYGYIVNKGVLEIGPINDRF